MNFIYCVYIVYINIRDQTIRLLFNPYNLDGDNLKFFFYIKAVKLKKNTNTQRP